MNHCTGFNPVLLSPPLPPTSDAHLEAYGSRALTSVVTSGVATLTRGRPLGHTMRRSLRYSAGTPRNSRGEMRSPRPPSQISITSAGSTEDLPAILRPRAGTYSPTTQSSHRLSGTFVDLRSNRLSASSLDEYSDRSSMASMASTSSTSTLTSLNLGELSQQPQLSPAPQHPHSPQPGKRQSQLALEVRRAEGQSKGETIPIARIGTPERPILEESTTTTSSQDTEEGSGEGEGEGEKSITIFDTPV